METIIIEATNGEGANWGKFLVGRPDVEWERGSALGDVSDVPEGYGQRSLLSCIGWSRAHLWVLDLQTGEGAYFRPGGVASADLDKHAIWVCPMYEPFLIWLYKQDLTDLSTLPRAVHIDAPAALYGYRRPRVNDTASEVITSLAKAGIDLRQRPDGEWEVSELTHEEPAALYGYRRPGPQPTQ